MSTVCPTLSLKELEEFDPGARQRSVERRFLCPLPGCEGKPADLLHRSLAANTETGLWTCHRCNERGRLREWWPRRSDRRHTGHEKRRLRAAFRVPPQSNNASGRIDPLEDDRPALTPSAAPSVASLADLLGGTSSLAGTPGEAYLARRAITHDLAASGDVYYHRDWYGRSAVVFLIRDEQHTVVAASGRYLDPKAEPKARACGRVKRGVYQTPGAMQANRIAIVEAPIDALSLQACGIQALALNGTSWPDWLAWRVAFREVLVATDADDAGDRAAVALSHELGRLGAEVQRLRPSEGCKDWNEWLQRDPDSLRRYLGNPSGRSCTFRG